MNDYNMIKVENPLTLYDMLNRRRLICNGIRGVHDVYYDKYTYKLNIPMKTKPEELP